LYGGYNPEFHGYFVISDILLMEFELLLFLRYSESGIYGFSWIRLFSHPRAILELCLSGIDMYTIATSMVDAAVSIAGRR